MSEAKASNPKEAFGSAKPPTSTVPMPVIYELGLAMLEGALKYGRHNYRVVGVRMSTYHDAMKRHIDAWWEGEDIDPESGMPHLVKAMACIAVVRDAEMLGLTNDDRPPSHPPGWQAKYLAKVAELKAKYPDPKPPFVRGDGTIADDPSKNPNDLS
jgi:dATP/dGTP diphosphohydrolase